MHTLLPGPVSCESLYSGLSLCEELASGAADKSPDLPFPCQPTLPLWEELASAAAGKSPDTPPPPTHPPHLQTKISRGWHMRFKPSKNLAL